MENQEYHSDEENIANAADPLIQPNHDKSESEDKKTGKNLDQLYDNLL